MWLRQKTEIRVSLWMFQVGILFPRAGKGWSEDLPTGKEPEGDNSQQVNADPICNQTLKQIFPRTQNCLDKWTKLMNDQEIIDIVSGYLLDFVEIPHQQKPPTTFNLSKEEQKLVDLDVAKLLRKGAIVEMEPCKSQFLQYPRRVEGGGRWWTSGT